MEPVAATVSKPIEPPSELKLIIDKMASYVVRNGEDFELLMRGKKDQRFSFLEPTDRHNAYYRYVKSTTRLDLEEEGEEEKVLAREAIEKMRDVDKPSKSKWKLNTVGRCIEKVFFFLLQCVECSSLYNIHTHKCLWL